MGVASILATCFEKVNIVYDYVIPISEICLCSCIQLYKLVIDKAEMLMIFSVMSLLLLLLFISSFCFVTHKKTIILTMKESNLSH